MAIAGLWRDARIEHADLYHPDHPAKRGRKAVPQPAARLAPARGWAAWLYLTEPETELLRPLPEGSISVETARPGSN